MDGANAAIGSDDEEPWRTALDLIAARGDDAEMYVARLASQLAAARCTEEVSKLSLVLEAIATLRREEEPGLAELGFVDLEFPETGTTAIPGRFLPHAE